MSPIHMGKVFKSFKEFQTALKLYETENNVVWVTKSSSSIINENKQRVARLQPPFPLDYVHKNIVFRCKFGGEQRPSKSNHIRQNQATWKIGCTALLQLIAYEHGLEVTKLDETHTNHECTEDEFVVIPENRKVDPRDLETLNVLLKGKVNPSRIKPILQEMNTKRMTPRDIANHR